MELIHTRTILYYTKTIHFKKKKKKKKKKKDQKSRLRVFIGRLWGRVGHDIPRSGYNRTSMP